MSIQKLNLKVEVDSFDLVYVNNSKNLMLAIEQI